jgi:hypothetical protein
MDQGSGRRSAISRKAGDRLALAASRDAAMRREIELERARSAAKTARLRALRLAKEASDRAEAEKQGTPLVKKESARPKLRRAPGQ